MEVTRRGKLVEYFKKNLSKGYTEESLKWGLVQQGYSRTDISRAIEKVRKELEEERVAKNADKEKPKIKYEFYGDDNRPIKIEVRKPLNWRKFFKNLFS
jgi:hypothetical protein|tara:strand:- start:499 stop:795 length:297 start_codon:yes stop_codon:yes gene_type:complete